MKHIFLRFCIFIVLGLLGFVIGVIGYQDSNFSSLLIYNDSVPISKAMILPNKPVVGEFTATENNLAIIRMRLRTYNRLNTTHLTFSLREKGSSTWLVSNTYALDRISDNLLYPFGFPEIADSKGKTYEFELSSVDGTPDDAVGFAGGYHSVATQYVQSLPNFIPEKIVSTLHDPYSWLYFFMMITPALMFLCKKYRLPLLVFMLLVYTYLPVSFSTNLIFFVAAAEFFADNAFIIGILALLQIPVTVFFGNMLAADRLAILTFASLVTGGIMVARDYYV